MGNQAGTGRRQSAPNRKSSDSTSNTVLEKNTRCSDWELVTEFDYGTWNENSSVLGFEPPVEKAPRHKVNKRPWSDTFTVSQKEKKICAFTCKVNETGREEKVKHLVKKMSVLAKGDRVLVIQIVLTKSVKLFVVDWHTDKLLGTYSFGYSVRDPPLQQCFLSADGSFLISRHDYLKRRKLGHRAVFDGHLRVFQVQNGICRRKFIIEDSLIQNSIGSAIAFDPRFSSRQVLIVSSSLVSLEDPSEGIKVVDLKKELVVNKMESPINQAPHHVTYTDDGKMFAVLVIDVQSLTQLDLPVCIHSIQIFESDSLTHLHTINFQTVTYCESKMLACYPQFSRDIEYLAVYTGSSADSILVIQVPILQFSLQARCRSIIMRYLSFDLVSQLPLPDKLKDYLLYKPIWD